MDFTEILPTDIYVPILCTNKRLREVCRRWCKTYDTYIRRIFNLEIHQLPYSVLCNKDFKKINHCDLSWLYRWKISTDFMFANEHRLSWRWVSMCQCVPESIMRRHANRISWDHIQIYQQPLSEQFIRDFSQRHVRWRNIVETQILSEQFLRDYAAYFSDYCWYFISKKQNLSEQFIHDFAKYIDWVEILRTAHFSEQFLRDHVKYFNDVCWLLIGKRQVISIKFINDFTQHLSKHGPVRLD